MPYMLGLVAFLRIMVHTAAHDSVPFFTFACQFTPLPWFAVTTVAGRLPSVKPGFARGLPGFWVPTAPPRVQDRCSSGRFLDGRYTTSINV